MFFHSPLWFLLLVPLIVLVVWKERYGTRSGILYSDIFVLKRAPKTVLLRLRRLVSVFPYFTLALLVIALARPQSGQEDFRVKAEGIAIVVCIDRSGSMQAVDFRREGRWITRLEAVKWTFREFVLGNNTLPGRPNDMIGLIAFGGFVDAICPLTLDHVNLVAMLDSIQLPEEPRDSLGQVITASFLSEERLTAIGDALVEAVERIKDSTARNKVIILLSDGEQTAGIATPLEGAAVAKVFGIKVYTIGIGTMENTAFLEREAYGKEMPFYHQSETIEQRTLLEIAQETGGQYFNAQNLQTLEEVYTQIDALEQSELEERRYTKYNEYFHLCLWLALGLILLYVVAVNTRFQTIP